MKLLVGLYRELSIQLRREVQHYRVKGIDSIGFISYRCTNCCKTCTIWRRGQNKDDELSRDEWSRVITQLSDYGVRSFEVFGGDALLRKDVVFDIISLCHEKRIETHFPTNANLCDKETIKNLIETGLKVIYLSIDDLAEEHDNVRGVFGNFARVQETLVNLVKLRANREFPKIGICTTLSNMNFRRFPKLIEFLERYPIDGIYPRPLGEFTRENIEASILDGLVPEPYFATSDGHSHLMSEQELKEMKIMIKEIKKKKNKIYIYWWPYYHTNDDAFIRGEFPRKNCRVATTVPIINPNGDVVPCPFFSSYVIGNLAKQKMDEIWGNIKHQKFISAQQSGQLQICRNCNTHMYYPSLKEMMHYYAARSLEYCRISSF